MARLAAILGKDTRQPSATRQNNPFGEIYDLFKLSRFVAIGDDYLSSAAPGFVSELVSRKESPITHLAIELPACMQQGSGLAITDSLINDVGNIYPGMNGAMASILQSAKASGISAIFFYMRNAFEEDTDSGARMAALIHSSSEGEGSRVLVYCGIRHAGLERRTRHPQMPIWKMSMEQPLVSHLSRMEGRTVPSLIMITDFQRQSHSPKSPIEWLFRRSGSAAEIPAPEIKAPLLSIRRTEITEPHPAGDRKHSYSGAVYVPEAFSLPRSREGLNAIRRTQA